MVQSTIQTREVTEYNDRHLKEAGEYIKKNADIITAEMNMPVQIARHIIQKTLELHTMYAILLFNRNSSMMEV